MRHTCKADSPIPCAERKAEMGAGQMYFADPLGWLWLRAKDVTKPWDRCPFCWGKLPSMLGSVPRIIESPPEGPWGPSDVEAE